MNEECKVAVIGAGVTGLCAAHLLSKRIDPKEIVVLEAAPHPGGTARTDRDGGYLCDRGPNGFLDKEPLTLEWVEELGLSDRIVHANEAAARRFILKGDRLVEIVAPPKFLLQPLLSIAGRARLLCEPLIPAKRDDTPESVWDFAARRIGKEAADTLVSAMVTGIFGGDAHQLSLEHCFPRMAQMEREHGGLVRAMLARKKSGAGGSPMGPGGTLTTFDGGIGVVAERAAELLGEQITFNFPVSEILKEDEAYRISARDGRSIRAQAIVLALPAYRAAQVVTELDPNLSESLSAIKYANVAVVCTGYDREQFANGVDGFGFLAPRNQGRRVLGCIWTSCVFPHMAPDGSVLLRTLYGGFNDPEAIKLTDDELLEHISREVDPLLHITGEPKFVKVFRHEKGIPQYLLNHGEILDSLDAAENRHEGLALAGNAYRGVSLNECVLSAHRAIERIGPRFE